MNGKYEGKNQSKKGILSLYIVIDEVNGCTKKKIKSIVKYIFILLKFLKQIVSRNFYLFINIFLIINK